MRPSLNKWYQMGDLHFYNVIATIIKECRVIFLNENLSNLHLVNKDFANIVLKVLCWLNVHFTPHKILAWDTSSRIISILMVWKWLAWL